MVMNHLLNGMILQVGMGALLHKLILSSGAINLFGLQEEARPQSAVPTELARNPKFHGQWTGN